MHPLATKTKAERRHAVAFLAQLIRLQRQVNELGRQLERVEYEMHSAVNELGRQRFEAYR